MKIFNSSQNCHFTMGLYKDKNTIILINCSNPKSSINPVQKFRNVRTELSAEQKFISNAFSF